MVKPSKLIEPNTRQKDNPHNYQLPEWAYIGDDHRILQQRHQ
jgi:hypothetical protein